MDSLWERVEPSFLNGELQSIQIVIVKGVTIVASDDENASGHSVTLGGDNTTQQGFDHHRTLRNDHEILVSNREAEITALLKLLEGHFERKAAENFMANRSLIQFESKLRPRVDITVLKIDGDHVGFNRLLQKWTRDALIDGRGRNSVCAWQQTLCFQLPETTDFDACTISLQASYKNLPFPLNSPQAEGLRVDLALLSTTKWDVLQLVPISSIDASLIYGVPIGLRAGLEESVDQHLEMGRLVQALFKHLGSKDCALVVRSRVSIQATSYSLFHSAEKQYFLLMPEMIESFKDCGTASCTGVLYRIVSPYSILQEMCPADVIGSLYDMGSNPFSGYIEASLDRLNCSSLNPLMLLSEESVMEQAQPEQKRLRWCERHTDKVSCSSGSSVDDNKRSPETPDEIENTKLLDLGKSHRIWNDDSGVGSLMKNLSYSSDRGLDCKDSIGRGGNKRYTMTVNSLGHNLGAMTSDDITSRHKEDSDGELNDSSDTCSVADTRDGMFGTFQYSQQADSSHSDLTDIRTTDRQERIINDR
jgi:hypothetical protein